MLKNVKRKIMYMHYKTLVALKFSIGFTLNKYKNLILCSKKRTFGF